jgi:hypothetical protein
MEWRPLAPQEASADAGGDWDEEPTVSAEEARRIQAQLQARRRLVRVHQPMAIAATASIIFTDVIGIINRVQIQSGNPVFTLNPEPYLWIHRIGAATATATYFTAGFIAWTMPDAYKPARVNDPTRKKKADSGEIHRVLSFAHLAAMGTTIATGILQANVARNDAWEPLVSVHTVAGFASAGLVLTAAIVIGTF